MRRDDTLEELISGFIQYLGCPCQYFEPSSDDFALISAYREARRQGEKEGFVPVIVPVEGILGEWLTMYMFDESQEEGEEDYNAEQVSAFRQEMLAAPLEDGREILISMMEQYKKMYEEDLFDIEEMLEELGGVEYDEDVENEVNDFSGYHDYSSGGCGPVLLAKIPVKNPWEVFAWVPFGGWNECPDTLTQMAVAKYWYEQHGAVPAVITHDVLEFDVPKPVDMEKAIKLAIEQYGYCPDIVEQGDNVTVGMLAEMLTMSKVWFFWWD